MNKKGFTMIELLVAVAIMGVLTIIAIPSVKHIQTNNSKSKYEAYEKSMGASGKLYVDSYEEDLFGATSYGCAAISYEDLKKKDLISDIQLKDVDCSNKEEKYTYVYVKKDKRGNHHYDTFIACRDSKGNILYKNGPDTLPPCELDSDDPPTIEISDSNYPGKKEYHIGEKPYIKIHIADAGIGLKARQKLSYQWFKGNEAFGAGGTVKFNNINYDPYADGYVEAPANIDDIDESTTYRLVFDGTISDVAGSSISSEKDGPWEYEVKYTVGYYLISYKANGGSANANGYTVASDGTIKHNGTAVVQKVKYKGSLASPGILTSNNSSGLNLTKNGYSIYAGHEWNTKADGSGRSFKQGTYGDSAKVNDLCDNARTQECKITLYAIWKPVTYTITYDLDGGTASGNPTTYTIETPTITLKDASKSGHTFTGWTGSNGTTATKGVTIPNGSVGNRSYKANYKAIVVDKTPYYNNEGEKFTRLDNAVYGTSTGGWIKLNSIYTTYDDPSTKVNLKWDKKISFIFTNQTINLTKDSIVVSDGEINFKAGTIVTSSQYRSAVSVKGGTFNIKGGILYSPYTTSKEEGTECVVVHKGKLTMSSGEIRSGAGNASGYGRGVNVKSGSFVMTGGKIYVNATKSGKWGGTGINGEGGTITVKGGTVQVVKGGKHRCLLCGNGAVIKVKDDATLIWGGVVRKGGTIFWHDKHTAGYVCIENSVKMSLVKKNSDYARYNIRFQKTC